ncbi:peptidoglycan-binding protein LysM [Robertkochia aurantiaca]|uniref:peptidoglycan-binding protein LysM n=1 Tax=Robertkochia aurantiaca TaxID=2873700 RepID=UPI001CCDE0EE|nr:peptidoglycan-binding protein LysM [Robertkochia sp. 3YJGBD-33]
MRKLRLKLKTGIVFLVLIASVGFTFDNDYSPELIFSATDDLLDYTVTRENDMAMDLKKPPFLGKSFNGFKEALAYNESRGNYFVVNSLGYMGKYQFGSATLRTLGVEDRIAFLNDPSLQEKVFIANLQRNKWVLRKYIDLYVGKTISGVPVTESGILAAAHLAGPGNVKRFLRTWGSNGFEDANGTSIRYYMKRFAGYDVSHIQADRAARL